MGDGRLLWLDPDRPGFARFLVRPSPGGGLASAKAEYDSVQGRIESSWQIADGTFRLRVVVPANTEARVHVPTSEPMEVTESGNPAAKAEGVEHVKKGDGEAIFTVGSGEYEFVAAAPR